MASGSTRISLAGSSLEDDDAYETDFPDQEAAALLARQNTEDLKPPIRLLVIPEHAHFASALSHYCVHAASALVAISMCSSKLPQCFFSYLTATQWKLCPGTVEIAARERDGNL
jgi:hypothetical protein